MLQSKQLQGGVQNPFHRLKHYRPGENDSKENHATEALAACLVFSEDFRAKFLEFLFGSEGNVPKALVDIRQIEVTTQHSTLESGILDLLLRTHQFGVVVEIKVGAKEDERHKAQLENYTNWMQQEFGEGKWALFTLVRNPDASFRHDRARRQTWSALFEAIHAFIPKCESATDRALLEALCDYLTLEGVVENMDYSKLVDYGKGWAAETAFKGLLGQTREKVAFNIGDLKADLQIKVGESPCFLFGRSSWSGIFGPGPGFNNKVTAWFCTPATEGSDCRGCEFRFEIQLWNKWHQNQWAFTAEHLPQWFARLQKVGFEAGAYAKRGTWIPWECGQQLKPENNYVVCVAPHIPVVEASLADIDSLSLTLAARVEYCIRQVDGLIDAE